MSVTKAALRGQSRTERMKNFRRCAMTALMMIVYALTIARKGTVAAETENSSTTTEEMDIGPFINGRTERSYDSHLEEVLGRPKSDLDDSQFRPYFDESIKRNVSCPLSKTAYLHCRIRNLGDRAVSWVRQRDLHILTVGRYTYTTDQRYTSIHKDNTDDWTLEIKDSQKADSGIFECQVNTEPKMSLAIELHIIAVEAHILEGPVLYIKSGSPVNLTCTVKDQVGPSLYVFWYHNGKVMNYEETKQQRIKVTTELGSTTISRLHIASSRPSDSGNYSCHPSYAESANITLHVLDGEKPAAMQHGRQNQGVPREPSFLMIVAFVVCSSFFLML